MSQNNTHILHAGVDVAELSLQLHLANRLYALTNDAQGHAQLLKRLRPYPNAQVVCEASGGYEYTLLKTLHQAQVLFTLVNPRQVRDFARASGLLAKTDRIDAALLARYGQVFQPAPTPMPTAAQQRLKALVHRRQELLQLLTQEQLRAQHHHDPVVRRLGQRLQRTLQKHLESVQAQIAALEQTDPAFQAKVQRLSAVQGIGRCTAWTLLAALPELGTLARGQAAALAGLAPYNYDSGPFRGQRHIAHGRPLARTALYMAALVAARCNPVLQPLYKKLRAAGKPAKVALVALMRKLVELANLLLKNPQLSLAS